MTDDDVTPDITTNQAATPQTQDQTSLADRIYLHLAILSIMAAGLSMAARILAVSSGQPTILELAAQVLVGFAAASSLATFVLALISRSRPAPIAVCWFLFCALLVILLMINWAPTVCAAP